MPVKLIICVVRATVSGLGRLGCITYTVNARKFGPPNTAAKTAKKRKKKKNKEEPNQINDR